MSGEILAIILGTGGLSAIVAAFVTGLFSKRKLGAEATEIITKAAAGVVATLESELLRQQKANAKLVTDHTDALESLVKAHRGAIDALVESHAEEIDEFRRVLQLHVAWDAIAISEIAKLGVNLPPAPPLLPARRFDHPVD